MVAALSFDNAAGLGLAVAAALYLIAVLVRPERF